MAQNLNATKRHILETYIKLCEEYGERNVTLKLLVKNIKYSQPCIYYHFHSFKELRGFAATHAVNWENISGDQEKFELMWDKQTIDELYNCLISIGDPELDIQSIRYIISGSDSDVFEHVNNIIARHQDWLSTHLFLKDSGISIKDEQTMYLIRVAVAYMMIFTVKYYHENMRCKMSKEHFSRVMTEIVYNGFRKLWRKAKNGLIEYDLPLEGG